MQSDKKHEVKVILEFRRKRGHFWGGNIYGTDNQRSPKRDSHL